MEENNTLEIQPQGSYVTGLVGALLGATIGAIAWCLVMQLGVIASLVGFVIGFLAEKGYTLLKGRDGKGKLVILIVAVAFGVLLGTFAAQAVDWYRSIAEFYPDAVITLEGEDYMVTYADIPVLIFYFLGADTEYLLGTLKDIGMGLLFAYMGVFGILKNTAKKTKANKENSSVEM